MININLLPQEFRVREVKASPLFSICVTVFGLVIFFVFLSNAVINMKNKADIETAKANLEAIRSTNNQVIALQNDLEQNIKPEHTAIHNLLRAELDWSELLLSIPELIPKNVWLENLNVEDIKERWKIAVSGFAIPSGSISAIAAVGELTTLLKSGLESQLQSQNIEGKVELLTTTKRKVAGRTEIVEFRASLERA